MINWKIVDHCIRKIAKDENGMPNGWYRHLARYIRVHGDYVDAAEWMMKIYNPDNGYCYNVTRSGWHANISMNDGELNMMGTEYRLQVRRQIKRPIPLTTLDQALHAINQTACKSAIWMLADWFREIDHPDLADQIEQGNYTIWVDPSSAGVDVWQWVTLSTGRYTIRIDHGQGTNYHSEDSRCVGKRTIDAPSSR